LTLHQAEALILIAAMFALFAWDRIRYDMVATLVLLAALLLGVVPAEKAFSGFGNQVIGVIAAILVVSRSIAVSGTVSQLMERVMRRVRSTSAQIGILTACTTFLSAFIKNVGTLGIFIPVATHAAERSRRPVSLYLMPLAFGSLIGGTITQIGTSPNLLISGIRADLTGTPFSMFDFTAVGLPLSCMAVLFLSYAWRVIPKNRRGARAPERRFEIAHYVSELRIRPGSSAIRRTVADLETLADGDIAVVSVTRQGNGRLIPAGDWTLVEGDILAIQGDPVTLKTVIDKAHLELLDAGDHTATHTGSHEMEIVEAVVMAESPLIGSTPRRMHLRARYEVNLLGVSRHGQTIRSRLRKHVFAAGDLVILQGWHQRLPDTLAELGCLPLADRSLGHTRRRNGWIPLSILAAAMLLVALKLMNVGVAVFGCAVLVVALRQITLKEAYESIDGPVIIMLGALIPVGEALKETGATELLGHALAQAAAALPATAALGLMMVVSMLVTPLLHHAAAVIVMGPIAAVVARNLGYHVDPFLMAVALGASCDFLTPIGHQNNAIIMARGGYRFADYWRLGLPLSVLVAVIGTLLIAWVWPL
jgi:di/tricarboxylate transporter